ncbi:uncharacterized protein (TIGR00375 family) [Oikeobacillus pervagus]|uniref:Uncharacterized protein (TIGR00375 family) n=1 Tax=Oikeobacillus pervagus TaxID=1325931 RepID=A0AAJ1WHM5_9BACI|nr:endonuclease Q family protein [Oikeobacillus pervagus]MDQ0213765.1 uncharacterized protein (TIGR00375 family) [Oikeobacillus pervagus]
MNPYFVDLHIHIGRTKQGKPVKITGSKTLTLTNILKSAKQPKGLDVVGIIDCHVPDVLEELESLLEQEKLVELQGGGLLYEGEVTLIPGVEIEVYDENCLGPLHVLAYFPYVETIREFSNWLSKRVKNIHLSTQRIYETAKNLQMKVKELGGLFIPAHVFTPFKSLYGKGVHSSLREVLDPEYIDGVELGLSSDTEMADQIEELHSFTFLTNSDAHSLAKMAREYQIIGLEQPDFQCLKKALHHEGDNRILANFGLDPRLGKYHLTACARCFAPKTAVVCESCGSKQFTKGVSERIQELASEGKAPAPKRPPYVHQVPLEFLPGLGPKTMQKLLTCFDTEMNIIHKATFEQLTSVVKPPLAERILSSRKGEVTVESGGGGKYGKVK